MDLGEGLKKHLNKQKDNSQEEAEWISFASMP